MSLQHQQPHLPLGEANPWGRNVGEGIEKQIAERQEAKEQKLLKEGLFADMAKGVNAELYNMLNIDKGDPDELAANILLKVVSKKIDEINTSQNAALKRVFEEYTNNNPAYLQEEMRKLVFNTMSENAVLQNRGISIEEASIANTVSEHFSAILEAENAVLN